MGLLALAAALFQVLRNTAMKRLGHALDEYIDVWGRFTFLLPFALAMAMIKGFPPIKPGFVWACLAFGLCQNLIGTLAFGEGQKVREIGPGFLVMLAGMILLSLAG